MYLINHKFAGLFFKNGVCCIDKLTEDSSEKVAAAHTYPNLITNLQIKIGEKDGVAVIKSTNKLTLFINGKDFWGKKRNDKFIIYCKVCGMEQKTAIKLLSQTKEESFLGIKYLRINKGKYFSGKEDPVEIYTNNYFIQNA